jgi:type II secretory pathway pseudopilin PulG
MIQVGMLTVLLVGELVLALMLGLGAVLFINARRRRQDRQAAVHLAGLIREREQQRFGAVRELLDKRYRYQGARLDQTAHALLRAEKYLYQKMLNAYIRRDAATIEQLHVQVDDLTDGYWKLEVPKGGDAVVRVGGADTDALLQRLQRENDALKQELQVTMETMARMLSEYASMFGGGPEVQFGKVQMDDLDQNDGFAAVEEAAEIEELDIPGSAPIQGEDLSHLWADAEDDLSPQGETLTISPPAPAADMDLSATDLDGLLGEIGATGLEQPGDAAALADSGPQELDDIWAQALAEQEAATQVLPARGGS